MCVCVCVSVQYGVSVYMHVCTYEMMELTVDSCLICSVCRHQLESEVESLRSLVHQSTSNHHKHTDLESQAVRERDIRIAALEADLARVRSVGHTTPLHV